MNEVTILEKEQIFGENKLNIFKKINNSAKITDFSILLGGYYIFSTRTGYYWIKPYDDATLSIDNFGNIYMDNYIESRNRGIRPIMSFSKIKNDISNEIINEDGLKEVEYGEYPQNVVNKKLQEELVELYQNGKLSETGKKYTTDSRKYHESDEDFLLQEHIEYEFGDKKYIRIKANSFYDAFTLSNGQNYKNCDYVWVEVSKVKWLVDEENDIALSKDILVAGIQFDKKINYYGDFENTNIYKFLNIYFIKDIQTEKYIDISKISGTYEETMALIEEAKRRHNAILDKSIIGKTLIKHL